MFPVRERTPRISWDRKNHRVNVDERTEEEYIGDSAWRRFEEQMRRLEKVIPAR